LNDHRDCRFFTVNQFTCFSLTKHRQFAEKTLADCFKFRNKIGMDVVLEALKLYKARRKLDIGALFNYAKICRVEKVMRPYLEASI
jgi:hypothetical protein